MRNFYKFIFFIGCLTSFNSAATLLVLPITGSSAAKEDMATINQLYHDALQEQFKGNLFAIPDSTSACGAWQCAQEWAKQVNADSVIYSTLNRLGSRWIFSSTLTPSDGGNVFNQRLTAVSIEDMDAVTKRMADALLNRKNTEQAATVDNITEKESDQEPERRRSLYSTGLAVGYMFPTTGHSFTWLNDQQNSVYDPNTSTYSMTDSIYPTHYSQIIRLSWMNTWELQNNLLLDAEVIWGAPDASFGANLNLLHLFNRGDFSPFIGGGLGIQYVHADDNASANKNNTGPTLNVQGGLMLFRTYDVHAMVRGGYELILNSDKDNSVYADVAVSYQKKESERRADESSGSILTNIAAGIGYTFLGLLAIGLITAAAQ